MTMTSKEAIEIMKEKILQYRREIELCQREIRNIGWTIASYKPAKDRTKSEEE